MPSALGNIEAGSFRVIPTSPTKAGPILDLYQRIWEGAPLGADDFVISADEKTSIQARRRETTDFASRLRTAPPESNMNTFAKVPGPTWRLGTSIAPRSSAAAKSKNGIAPVDRLVSEVMGQEPYKSARRVFWIMDNCSAHRGQKAADRFRAQWPNAHPHPHSGPRQLAQSS